MKATIGQLEKLTGMSRTTLRYYDDQLNRKPVSMNGRRRKRDR